MLTKINVALAAAVALSIASPALAATRHPVRHQRIVRAVPSAQERVVRYNAYAYSPSCDYVNARGPNAYRPGYTACDRYPTPLTGEETYLWIQDQSLRRSN